MPRTAYLKCARWLSVALATRRFETLKSSESRFESRRGRHNNDWTRDTSNTSGVRRAWVANSVRILIGLMGRSSLQRTTTSLVSLRAGNKRQRSDDTPLRWNRCKHRLRQGCCWKTCFVATRFVSSGPTCVETVVGNVGHGTRLNVGICGMLFRMDLNLVASVTVLLTETWYFVDLWP